MDRNLASIQKKKKKTTYFRLALERSVLNGSKIRRFATDDAVVFLSV